MDEDEIWESTHEEIEYSGAPLTEEEMDDWDDEENEE